MNIRATKCIWSIAVLSAIILVGTTLAGAAKDTTKKPATRDNLKQLGLALMMYAQDYDEKLPPMKSKAVFKSVIDPYVRNSSILVDPATKKLFALNPSLSERNLEDIWKEGYEKKQGIIAIYQATSSKSNLRYVLRMAQPRQYINGKPAWEFQAMRVNDKMPTVDVILQIEWATVKKASNIH